jgi:nifR3 family TIM-barrel protein
MNIWDRLKDNGPIFALAPMEDVTDTVFRRIIADCGRPDLFFTEFTNCEGAQSVGQARVVHRLKYTEEERPLIAQVWGVTPDDYYKTAKLIKDMGFDGVDINMGCPVKKVIKQGACSALIKNPSLAKEIVEATKEGAQGIPVSVKTRIGFNSIQTEEWISYILAECSPAALTIHGRTVKELSKVPNHWDEIAKAVAIRNSLQKDAKNQTLIIGNGDIMSYQQGLKCINSYNLDGVMIGRGVFSNPWIFNPEVDHTRKSEHEKIQLLIKHLSLWKETWSGSNKNFQNMKKYYKIYLNSFKGASQLRNDLMNLHTPGDTLEFLNNYVRVPSL